MGKPATMEANAFRFYADGTESGSSPLANQDIGITVNVDPGNQQVHLRYRMDETNGGDGAATDDYQIDYDKNSSGTWVPITGSTSGIQADPTSSLTDGNATTNRGTNGITDGAGSFVAGEQEEVNGVIEDRQLTANNFTEHVWALLVVKASVSNSDTFDFRMTRNGGTPGMTNNVTPRITIQKTEVSGGAQYITIPDVAGLDGPTIIVGTPNPRSF